MFKYLSLDKIYRRENARDRGRAETIRRLLARVAELEAIVARLPRTADGVPATPGMEIWIVRDDSEIGPRIVKDKICSSTPARWEYYSLLNCYSTKDAAEAARQHAAKAAGGGCE